jgi:hypothetical protein
MRNLRTKSLNNIIGGRCRPDRYPPPHFMIKIKQDATSYILDCGKEEFIFLKDEPSENIRLIEQIIYSLGINTESIQLIISLSEN